MIALVVACLTGAGALNTWIAFSHNSPGNGIAAGLLFGWASAIIIKEISNGK